MNMTSSIGKCVDTIVRFFLTCITYSCWILTAIVVMFSNPLHKDFANYWSLTAAIIYYGIERSNLSAWIVSQFKGRWRYPKGREYHESQWNYILINIIPIISLPIALLIIHLFPNVSFDTNGLTFIAMLLTVMTSNHSFSKKTTNNWPLL